MNVPHPRSGDVEQTERASAAPTASRITIAPTRYQLETGGEKFLILLTQLHTLALEHRGVSPQAVLTISVGLATSHPKHRVPSSTLVAEADTALYEAKTTGRDRIALATTLLAQPTNPPGRLPL